MRKILPYVFLILALSGVLYSIYLKKLDKANSVPDINSGLEMQSKDIAEEDDLSGGSDEYLVFQENQTDAEPKTNNQNQTEEDSSKDEVQNQNQNQSPSQDGIDTLPVPVQITIDENDFNMTLVNRKYRMPDDYPLSLKPCLPAAEIRLHTEAAEQYEQMYNAAKNDGCTLSPYSGYRRYSTQKTNYENKTQHYINQGYNKEQAKTLAATIIMPPGSSEHNLGLAMDICGTSYDFDQTKEFRWLKENAENYGFILRYTKEKQHITKVVYEPWHWRYVGVENAKKINNSGLCLEEYLGKDAG